MTLTLTLGEGFTITFTYPGETGPGLCIKGNCTMKRIVMSGITSGIGLSWLKLLDQAVKAKFYLLVRNEQKFYEQVSVRPLANDYNLIQCSLDSLESVENAAVQIQQCTNSIDILINNAGIWPDDERALSCEGFELTLAVNHLAPYLLSCKLIQQLQNSSAARIINTASFRHSDAKVDMEDFQLRKGYTAARAYCNSKLYNILFTQKLAELLSETTVTVNCFDPGMVDTPMFPKGFPGPLLFLYPFVRRHMARTPEKGAETGLYLSVSSECREMTGFYFKDCKQKKPSMKTRNRTVTDWLWHESNRLTGFGYSNKNVH